MEHPRKKAYTLVSFPNQVAEVADCARRARGERMPERFSEEYGDALGTMFRFQTAEGEATVFRLLWTKEGGEWRIAAYDVELP